MLEAYVGLELFGKVRILDAHNTTGAFVLAGSTVTALNLTIGRSYYYSNLFTTRDNALEGENN
jgi:hypothetical protein